MFYSRALIITCFQIIVVSFLVNYYCVSQTEAAVGGLPGGASVFPLLTSGWYPKPAPHEMLFLGFALVQILAMKFAASAAGVPYHLNDIKLDHLFPTKYFRRGKRSSSSILAKVSQQQMRDTVLNEGYEEFAVLERVLLALRRVDTHDCFMRYICQANQDQLSQQNGTTFSDIDFDNAWLELFRLRPTQKPMVNYDEPSIWDIYGEALNSKVLNCNKKYAQCPLTEMDLTKASLLSGLF